MRVKKSAAKKTTQDWTRFDAMTDAEHHAAAMKDPDAQPIRPQDMKKMKRVPQVKVIRRALALTKRRAPEPVEISTDNIFADLGFPNPEEHLVKAQIVVRMTDIIRTRRFPHNEAARRLGIRSLTLSKMLRGDFRRISIARLRRFLVVLARASASAN